MADSNFVQIVKFYQELFRSHSFDSLGGAGLTSTNVIIGETFDWLRIKNNPAQFPRIELLVWKKWGDGPVNTTDRDERNILQLGCYLQRANKDLTEQDYYDIMNFLDEIEGLVISRALASRIAGTPICEDFLNMDYFPELDIEGEIFKNVASGIFQFTIFTTRSNFS